MRALVAIGAIVCVLGATATADARIVVGKSIAGVALGDSVATVKRKLGKPTTVMGANKILNYKREQLVIEFNKGVVTSMTTFNTRERTAKGVGPGSTLKAVKAAYGADACP